MNYIHCNGANAKNGKREFDSTAGIKINLLASGAAAEFTSSVYLFEQRCYKMKKKKKIIGGSEFLNLDEWSFRTILVLLVYLQRSSHFPSPSQIH